MLAEADAVCDRVTGSLMQWNRAPVQVRGTQRFKSPGAPALPRRRCLVSHTQLRNTARCLHGGAIRGPPVCAPLHVDTVLHVKWEMSLNV